MRRGDGRYRPPTWVEDQRLGAGVAFTAPHVFMVPHGTPVAAAAAHAAARGAPVTPRVVSDPVTKQPVVALFHLPANMTRTDEGNIPGLPPKVAVAKGIIAPESQHVTGPAVPGPALPAQGRVVLPGIPSPADLPKLLEKSPFVNMAKILTQGFMQSGTSSPSSGGGGGGGSPSSNGDGGGAAPPAPAPAPVPGSTKRGLIIAGVAIAALLAIPPLFFPREVRS